MSKRPSSAAGPSKRARFASPSHLAESSVDPLEEDLPSSSAALRAKAKKSIKGREGYDSDSSDDGEGVVLSRVKKPEEDEDDDMFGGGEEKENEAGEESAKPPKPTFLNLSDIPDQEYSSRIRDDQASDDSFSSDSEDEARRAQEGKGLDGPMGYEMTGFNMKKELEEGKMTADGEEYVVNDKEEGEVHDKWLEGMSKEAVKKARRGKRERERLEKEREQKEAEEMDGPARQEKEYGIMNQIVELLERGETVLEGLQRLGGEVEKARKKAEEAAGGGKKKSWAERQKERKALLAGGSGATEGDGMQVDAPAQANPFSKLSDLTTSLQSFGHLDVYSLTRESLQRMVPAAASAPTAELKAPLPPPADTRTFHYRFSKMYLMSLPEGQRPVEREVFGPFPLLPLLAWKASGVFGGETAERVEMRVESGDWGSWKDVVGV